MQVVQEELRSDQAKSKFQKPFKHAYEVKLRKIA